MLIHHFMCVNFHTKLISKTSVCTFHTNKRLPHDFTRSLSAYRRCGLVRLSSWRHYVYYIHLGLVQRVAGTECCRVQTSIDFYFIVSDCYYVTFTALRNLHCVISLGWVLWCRFTSTFVCVKTEIFIIYVS